MKPIQGKGNYKIESNPQLIKKLNNQLLNKGHLFNYEGNNDCTSNIKN